MYRSFLLTQVSTVLDTEPFLLTDASVMQLSSLVLQADEQAQSLLARLIQRKRCAWILSGTLQYREVPETAKAVASLIELGFLEALTLPETDDKEVEKSSKTCGLQAIQAGSGKLDSDSQEPPAETEVVVLDDSSSDEDEGGLVEEADTPSQASLLLPSLPPPPLTWVETVATMLHLLNADDLRTFHLHSQLDTGVPASARPKKGEYVASLAKALHALRSRSRARCDRVLSILYTCAPLLDPSLHAPPIIRVPPTIADLFDRIARIYLRPEPVSAASTSNPYDTSSSSSSSPSASPTNPLATQVLVRIGQVAYPRYTCMRTCGLVWPTIHDLDQYEQALALMRQVEAHMTLTASLDLLIRTCVRPRWTAIVTLGVGHVTGLYWFQRFHAGWPLTLALEWYLHLLARGKRYADVVALCATLLGQRLFRRNARTRGEWYELAALTLHAHIKDRKAALRMCFQGLEDPLVAHPAAQLALQKRAARLQVQLRIPFREQRHFEHVRLAEPKVVTFFGTKARTAETESLGQVQGVIGPDGKVALPPPPAAVDGEGEPTDDRPPGMPPRPLWECDNGDHVHVEEYALREYFKVGGWVGKHAENSTLGTLFGMLLYEEMFMDGVPGVFETEYQNAPLDLYSDSFYDSRAVAIDAKLAAVRDGHFVEVLERVDAAERERKPMVSGLSWDFSLQEITEIAIGIGGPALATILSLMARDPRGCRSGMPDLILWVPGASPPRVAFSEVKGPGDTLSDKQRVWMDVLIRAGCEVHLCLVKAESESDPSGEENGEAEADKVEGRKEVEGELVVPSGGANKRRAASLSSLHSSLTTLTSPSHSDTDVPDPPLVKRSRTSAGRTGGEKATGQAKGGNHNSAGGSAARGTLKHLWQLK